MADMDLTMQQESIEKPKINVPERWMLRFFTIWTSQALSLLGSQLVQFALVWWLTERTGSATVLATSTIVALLPQIAFGPIAGALIDRWNRRMVMILADGIIAVCTALLAYLFFTEQVQVWHIYAILFIRALGGAFHFPAMEASTPMIVPKDQLTRVAGLNQTLQGALAVVAPPLGALLVAVLPMHGVMLVDVVTGSLAVLLLSVFAIPQPERNLEDDHINPVINTLRDMREGFRYVAQWPGLLMVMLLGTALNFIIMPGVSLIPLLITNHFRGGAAELGWFNSAWGIGFLVGGIVLGLWGGFNRKIITTLLGLVVLGVSFAAIGFVPGNLFTLALVAVFIAGFSSPITNGPLMAMLQATVAPEMQGRVLSLLFSASMAISPLSLAIAGPTADAFGITSWFIIAGIVSVILAIIGFFIPALMNIENGHEKAKEIS
jgi:MFS transporter, DHA3 family, macrolide efflux protein